jgi:hypothetical protein
MYNRISLAIAVLALLGLLAMCSCGDSGNPGESVWDWDMGGNYSGTYEVIINPGQVDEATHRWPLGAHFFSDDFAFWTFDDSGGTCEMSGTYMLALSGPIGNIELLDTAFCSGWFEGTDYSAPGPRGQFNLLRSGTGITLYRRTDSMREFIRLSRVYY